jgi:hypothetical protein
MADAKAAFVECELSLVLRRNLKEADRKDLREQTEVGNSWNLTGDSSVVPFSDAYKIVY